MTIDPQSLIMSKTKILIAEDEEAVLEIMSAKVASAGYQVIMARNGKEALEKIQSESPDVVLLDMIMPQMDGFEVLTKLRQNPPSSKWIPVVVISTLDKVQNIKEGFDLQADHYLAKPCRIEDILKAIKLMLSLIPIRHS
jgi:CheY-like chemotaxis protein